jgi:nitronate monooxygenase
MAGGPSTVALAAAVCEAGGLGFLAAGYVGADVVDAQVAQLRTLSDRPFGVNVFLVHENEVDTEAVDAYVAQLRPDAERVGAQVGEARFDDDALDAKLAVLLEARVAVVSFTFGCPSPDTVRALQAVGTQVWVTVSRVDDARTALGCGCDALVLQGVEAGGHRAAFDDDLGEGGLDALALVRAVAAETDLPLVAAGGVMDVGDVHAALDAGASAVQCGTAFLLADEAGTNPVHRSVVGADAATSFTHAFTGRTARGIENEFMRQHADAPLAYPHVHHATSPIRIAARRAGNSQLMSLWAGARHTRARAASAADIVRALTP